MFLLHRRVNLFRLQKYKTLIPAGIDMKARRDAMGNGDCRS
jgi:hypothetical protein